MPEPGDFITKSVTAGDAGSVQGGVLNLIVPQLWSNYQNLPIPPTPPVYWAPERDDVLRATINAESMWAAAVGIAITQTTSKAFEIHTDQPRKARKFQQLYLYADGRTVGWVSFLSKHLMDFLCTDNGAFVEIVRAKKAVGSEIVGLRHLDSRRCTRTGDPKTPLLYRDRKNKIHELRDYQCMLFSDMPDPSELWYGVGHCAASRSYYAIYKLASIEWYLREKVGGLRPLAVYVVNGLLQQQIEGAVKSAQEQTVAKGLAAYMGAVIVGVPGDKPPQVATIPLSELPDRFAPKDERDNAIFAYAANLGIDPQDLQPLSGSSLGTGAQSQVLDDKARGKGLAAWMQQWIHQNNELVLPDSVTWVFIENDIRDKAARADYDKKRIESMNSAVEGGIVMPEQAVQVLVDQEVLPREFLAQDATAAISLSDTGKLSGKVKPMEAGKPDDLGLPAEGETTPEGEQAAGAMPPVDIAQQGAADEMADIPSSEIAGEEEAGTAVEEEETEEEEQPEEETEEEEAPKKKKKEWKAGRHLAGQIMSQRKIADIFKRASFKSRLERATRSPKMPQKSPPEIA